MSARLDSPEGSYPANMTDQPTHQVDATQAEGGANEGGMEGDGGGVRPVNAGSAVATDPAVANQSAVAFESVVANNPAITTESAVATKSSTSNDDMQGISSPIQSTGGSKCTLFSKLYTHFGKNFEANIVQTLTSSILLLVRIVSV